MDWKETRAGNRLGAALVGKWLFWSGKKAASIRYDNYKGGGRSPARV
jgi:hypothetical protein